MRRLGWIIAVMFAATACGTEGDRSDVTPDDDADPQASSFTAFVIELVRNRTANDTEPVEFAAFESLPDPDVNNKAAYASLFE